jgi:hypothetical protein
MRDILDLSRPLCSGALCALLLVFLSQTSSPAQAADASAPVYITADSLAPPLAGFNLDGVWTFFETTLKSRARMLQFGIIGMCVALYFMFRARD